MDNGSVVDGFGEVHQSSLRINRDTQRLMNLDRSFLGIVLKVHTADGYHNKLSYQYADRVAQCAVAEVLIVLDGRSSAPLRLTNVVIPPSRPSGLDNYEEHLPRGSTQFINGENLADIVSGRMDAFDLDGDWAVVQFLGGNMNAPYISNWWPNPRNRFDPQTSGSGHPTSQGVGSALEQNPANKGRVFKRINGVEYVVNDYGDIFVSTHYANSVVTPTTDMSDTKGRFPRSYDPAKGGGIRINVKQTQPLELNWNTQEDGIGLNDSFDPTLPQTNPQATTPVTTGNRSALYVRLQNKSAIFEVPSLFQVKSQQTIELFSGTSTSLNIGTSFLTTVGGIMETTVTSDITHTSQSGNILVDAKAGSITINAEVDNIDITAAEGDIGVTASAGDIEVAAAAGTVDVNAVTINVGTTLPEPAIRGTTFGNAQDVMLTAVSAALALLLKIPGLNPAEVAAVGAATSAITAYLDVAYPASLSNTTNIGQ